MIAQVALSAGDQKIILVNDVLQPAPIMVRAEVTDLEFEAARQLRYYLSELSGQEFEIETIRGAIPRRAIVLDVDLQNQPGAENLHPHGYMLLGFGNRVYISGGSDEGLMYGVFGFLEKLGCRFWTHDEELLPYSEQLEIVNLDEVRAPAFDMHELMNLEANVGLFPYKVGHGLSVQFSGGHNLCGLLEPYAEEFPDFLPMDGSGNRRFNNLHMNYLADEMPQVLARELAQEVERRDFNLEGYIYFAGMGDWYGGLDQSEESLRIYAEETWLDPDGRAKPGYIAPLLRMINHTAEILEKKYPGIRVGTFAYMTLEAPPAHTKPNDNVYLWVPRLRHDTVRSIVESDRNQSFLNNLKRWLEIAPNRVYIWEYGANFHNFWMPFPNIRSIAENIRVYHELGVSGIRIQGNYVSMGSDLIALKNWVWGKLLWDPLLDLDDLIKEFVEGYYGPAAPAMLEYVTTLENFVREPMPIVADEFRPIRDYISKEMLDQLSEILNQALALSEGLPEFTRRVMEARASVEAAYLFDEGTLLEKDGELIRTDFGESTWERALSVIEHIRNASPREWGTGRSYQEAFLSRHGGPVANLSEGLLRVNVRPTQLGKTSFYWNDKLIIDSTWDQPTPPMRIFYPDEDFGEDNVSFYAFLGIGHWSPDTKQIIRRSVELDGYTTRMIGTLQRTSPEPQFSEGKVVVETRYPIQSPEQIVMKYRDQKGDWHGISFEEGKIKIEVENLDGLAMQIERSSVVVLDLYSSIRAPSAEIIYDSIMEQITTFVKIPTMFVPRDEAVEYLERSITIRPTN